MESEAGVGAGFPDVAYASVGARLVPNASDVWHESELLLKVKEPIEQEYQLLHPDLTLFTYLHLAPNLPLTDALMRSGATGLAYETVETAGGKLPLLSPMSEIAGRLAAHAGAYFLQAPLGGPGVLMGARSSSTSPSTRAAALRPRIRPPTPSRCSRSTGFSTTA